MDYCPNLRKLDGKFGTCGATNDSSDGASCRVCGGPVFTEASA